MGRAWGLKRLQMLQSLLFSSSFLRHRFEQFREALMGLDDALFHPALQRAIAVGDRLEHRVSDQPGSSSGECFEGECLQAHVSRLRQSLKLKGVDNALWRAHFVVDATKGELVAALIFVKVAPASATPGLKRLEGHGESSWSEPLNVQVWLDESSKHQLTRRVKLTRDEHLLFPWFCRNRGFLGICH